MRYASTQGPSCDPAIWHCGIMHDPKNKKAPENRGLFIKA